MRMLLSMSYNMPELNGLNLHLLWLFNRLLAGIGVDHCFVSMRELRGWSQVMHVGRYRLDRVDEADVLIHADIVFN